MKKLMMILVASLVFSGSIFAQRESDTLRKSHWADFVNMYDDHFPTVAFIQLDGKFITASDNWADLEIAPFVGDECRGHAFLFDQTESFGDPYPVVELSLFRNNEEEAEVSFKMYDHAKGIEYDRCFVNAAGKPLIIKTGEDHTEEYFDPDKSVILSFYSSSGSKSGKK